MHRHQRAGLDAGGRVADDVVEAHLAELLQHALDAILVERVLVARLRGGQDIQLLALLVLDERLVQVGFVVDDVDEVIDNTALASHDQVEVAQAHVEIDHRDLVPGEREARREARAGGGLAHASLAGGHDDDSGHR